MKLVCINHWNVAIETHKKNHPEAVHICQDIATVRPLLMVPDSKLDLLLASPTCTYHSRARGGKPTSDQQRSDPWHIITWLTELRVRCLIVENVPEFVDWSPVDPRTGRPLKSRRGEYFQRWVDTIKGLGFQVDWRILNAADFGDATTRQRFFLIARSDGKPLRWPEPTHARVPQTDALFGTSRARWRPARDVINWTIRGTSIFTRKRPLSPKTLARIYAGAVKFKWPEPFLVILRQHMTAQSIDQPLPAITAGGQHIGLAQPFVFANRNNNIAKDPDTDPLPTICTRGNAALVEPFIATVAHGNTKDEKNPDARRCRSLDEPLQTIHAGGGKFGVVEPFVFRMNQGKERLGEQRPVEQPLCTVTASGTDLGLVEPVQSFILNRHGDRDGTQAARAHSLDDPTPTATCGGAEYLVEPFVLPQGSEAAPQSIADPLSTVVTVDRHAIVEPFVLSQHSGGAPRSVEDPVPGLTCDGAHALIAPYYGSGSGQTCRTVDHPLPTATAKARFGMVLPVTHHGTNDRARDVDADPLPTVTGAHRGELAFIAASFGERDGQAPRVRSVDEPAPTICAQGRVNLVQPGQGYDILFRMLEPSELAAAMGFNDEETTYEFAGTKADVIRQIGNAVPVNLAAALVGALMDPTLTRVPATRARRQGTRPTGSA